MSTQTTPPDPIPDTTSASTPSTLGSDARVPRTPRRRARPTPQAPRWLSIDAAAGLLDLDPNALRARCRRAAERTGKTDRVDLGGGVQAIKVGAFWRVAVPAVSP